MAGVERTSTSPTLAIVGGGLAGLAAAEAASRRGLRVELFEAHRQLGGRAGSFHDPTTGLWVDHCQHVALGCCTTFREFCRHTAIDDAFERHTAMTFIGPRGTRHRLAPSPWLPAPLHFLPSLLRLNYLTLGQRLRILRNMARLARVRPKPGAGEPTIAAWLAAQGESPAALDGFWNVLLVSALSEWPERIALSAARQVLCEGMLASREAADLYLPRIPLSELYDQRLKSHLQRRGVRIHTATPIRRILGDASGARGLQLIDGTRLSFDLIVAAVPWHAVARLLDQPLRERLPRLDRLEQLAAAPITAAHFWFDRPILSEPHAVVVGRTSQWVFQRPAPPIASHDGEAWHVQVVISGSHAWSGVSRQTLRDRVAAELEELWPAARAARRLHWRVVTRPAAVFAPQPGSNDLRPAQTTAVPQLFLAGDWTSTGWPATMEGAVRSGYMAVEAIR